MHPFDTVRLELLAEARLDLIAASFLRGRWPSIADKFIVLAAQALALRAQWEVAHDEGIQGTSRSASPPPLALG